MCCRAVLSGESSNEIKNEMINCPSCRSAVLALYDEKFEFPATQKFALQPKNSGKELYKYLICKNCGLHFIRNDSKLDLLTLQSQKALRLKEPTDHLEDVSNIYSKLINSSNSNKTKIFGISYKDDNLLDKLAANKGYSTVKANRNLFDNEISLLAQQSHLSLLNDEVQKSKARGYNTYLVASRCLEHMSLEGLDLLLKGASFNGIYVEMGNFYVNSFDNYCLWNERRNYFSTQHIAKMFGRYGYFLHSKHEFGELDPYTCTLWTKNKERGAITSNLSPDNQLKTSSVFESCDKVISGICSRIQGDKLALFGAGHKGITLANRLRDAGYLINLYDGNEALIGQFANEFMIKDPKLLVQDGLNQTLICAGLGAISKIKASLEKMGYNGTFIN